jgi:hypothetical protein
VKRTMVIPSYWGRPTGKPWVEGDAVYDHATPLDQEGTLLRTLESLNVLDDRSFDLVVLGCATGEDIEGDVEAKLSDQLRDSPHLVHTYLVTHSHLRKFHEILDTHGAGDLKSVLSLRGYPNIRNMCIFVPYIMGSEVAVLIDDDEVFEDPRFMNKATEFINRRYFGRTIDGVAGYYLNEDGNYYDKVVKEPWMTYWDRFGSKTEAFDKIIGQEPRLKPTPFAFGGCMIIHRNMIKHVPFDPRITRGEDTDYVLNARMFGFRFFLDNQLSIKHLPPPKNHPIWKRLREDIRRLLYDKTKIEQQQESPTMHMVEPEDFDPYPGAFLKGDLEDKIFKTNLILALDYLADKDLEACKEAINNIWIAKNEAIPEGNVFETFVAFQQQWRRLIQFAHDHRSEFQDVVMGSDTMAALMLELGEMERAEDVRGSGEEVSEEALATLEFFQNLEGPGCKHLLEHMLLKSFAKDDVVIAEGQEDFTLYVVRAGRLRVVRRENGTEVVIARVGRGEHVGEIGLMTGLSSTTEVIADDDCLLLSLSRKHLEEVMLKYPETALQLVSFLGKKMGLRLRSTSQLYAQHRAQDSDVIDSLAEKN